MPFLNTPAPGAREYYPLNDPIIGSALPAESYPQNKELPPLFQPLTIRGVTFPNRIFVSPMCQYSSDNGHATDYHLVHLGGYAIRGPGAIIVEATAVVPEGRISPEDAGLWTDTQIAPLKRIVDFAHAHGSKIGIQLAHAGRKASTYAPWVFASADLKHKAPGWLAGKDEGGWPDEVYGPSEIKYAEDHAQPKPMTEENIKYVTDAFVAATKRSIEIGFDFVEIHGAHGYLIHSFLSPLSNARTDGYGGAFENRTRILLEITKAVRAAWGDRPLFVRLSGTDWAEGPEKGEDGEWKQWGIVQTAQLSGELAKLGVDFIDVSSSGNWAQQKIPVGPGYQVPLAEAVKKAVPNTLVGAVGLITDGKQANAILVEGKADVILVAREFQRSPNFVMEAAEALGVAIKPAVQTERAWSRVLVPKNA
ncbi:FMN-linked oxidoreductase [Amylostereum chailletii]|nr:FMN-linked oxidoreductase [Amylostereum chailletii]